jgi:hypothetical protein
MMIFRYSGQIICFLYLATIIISHSKTSGFLYALCHATVEVTSVYTGHSCGGPCGTHCRSEVCWGNFSWSQILVLRCRRGW